MSALTQNRCHHQRLNLMFYVEFAFVAHRAQLFHALVDTLIEYGNVSLQNRQTEREIQQFPLWLPSVSYEERIKFYDN